MNCAKITVTGNGNGFNGPALFVANLASVNDIKTQLGSDVIFPDPGDSVEFGGDGKRALPIGVASASSAAILATVPANNVISTTIPLDVGEPTTLQSVTRATRSLTESRSHTKAKKKHQGKKTRSSIVTSSASTVS